MIIRKASIIISTRNYTEQTFTFLQIKPCHNSNNSLQYERQETRLFPSTSWSIHLRITFEEWWNAEFTRIYTTLRLP